MVDTPRNRNKGKDKDAEPKMNARDYLANLGFTLELINSDTSLQEFIKRVRRYMDQNNDRTPTSNELDQIKQGIDWFERLNAVQEEARMLQADPRRRADWNRAQELERENVRNIANNIGVDISDEDVKAIALDARLNGLTEQEIRQRMNPFLQASIAGGADLAGRAAEFEREILQWSRRNGLQLTGQTLAKYVQAGVEGRSTMDDVKNDLRRTYLLGQYPAWSDRIEKGFDPAEIAQPYIERMARLLEVDEQEIDLNDQLLQRGMQSIGQDGKPRVMPLYEFENEIRKDPRWEFTENAYDVYSRVGTNLLRTFGFR